MSTSTLSDAQKFIPKLLDILKKAKAKAVADTDQASEDREAVVDYFKRMKHELENMKDMPPKVKQWEKNLFNQFTVLERRLYKIILGAESDIKGALVLMLETVQQIDEVSVPPVQLMPSIKRTSSESWKHSAPPELGLAARQKMSQEWSRLGLEDLIYRGGVTDDMKKSYEHLGRPQLKLCLLSFSIFPENAMIKKRCLIYWWIGEGFVTSTYEKTAEEVGEDVFEELMRTDLIQPHFNASSAVVNNCTMHPWVRCMLLSVHRDSPLFTDVFEDFEGYTTSRNDEFYFRECLVDDKSVPQHPDSRLLTVFNVNVQYLSSKPEWLTKLKKVEVLQLGRWQNLATHHIEVDDEGFLNGLGLNQKRLKYLSLRGISGITQIPSSILNLINLKILDLRACHNLEDLPSDISSLRKLTHLDISECYLLDRMPKGLNNLFLLEVLEGFVIGAPKHTPCRLGDFAKLTKLKRLSIHLNNDAVVQTGELSDLEKISSLRRLKISWGVVAPNLKAKVAFQSLQFSFPPDLVKLELQGIPLAHVPEWLNPIKLKNLKKLYIRGGELDSLDHRKTEHKWTVEILRLKYLKKFEIGLPKLKEEFPHLQHLEKIQCHETEEDKYDDDIVWRSKAQGYI